MVKLEWRSYQLMKQVCRHIYSFRHNTRTRANRWTADTHSHDNIGRAKRSVTQQKKYGHMRMGGITTWFRLQYLIFKKCEKNIQRGEESVKVYSLFLKSPYRSTKQKCKSCPEKGTDSILAVTLTILDNFS